MIERVPVGRDLSRHIGTWRALRDDGWDVSALVAPDQTTVVFLACKEDAMISSMISRPGWKGIDYQ
jgi:hypothetical protein